MSAPMQVVEKKSPYSPREGWRSAAFGWASDMVHIAVNRDDPDGFMTHLNEIGGIECEVLLSGCLARYAASHGAVECLRALFAAGFKSAYPLAYWLRQAEKPSYGPRAGRQVPTL